MKPGDLIVTAGDPLLVVAIEPYPEHPPVNPGFGECLVAHGEDGRTHTFFTGLPVKIVGEKDRDAATA